MARINVSREDPAGYAFFALFDPGKALPALASMPLPMVLGAILGAWIYREP